MPKASFLHFPGEVHLPKDQGGRDIGWTVRTLEPLGHFARPLIADLCSTDDVPLVTKHVDWVPVHYLPGTLVDAPCSLEIDTFGYPDRVEKVTEEATLKVKRQIIEFVNDSNFPSKGDAKFFMIPPDKPLIWVRFLLVPGNPQAPGIHV